MGWSEGEGIGKNKDGITEPIKAKQKLNSKGLGFTDSAKFVPEFFSDEMDRLLAEETKKELEESKKSKKSEKIKTPKSTSDTKVRKSKKVKKIKTAKSASDKKQKKAKKSKKLKE